MQLYTFLGSFYQLYKDNESINIYVSLLQCQFKVFSWRHCHVTVLYQLFFVLIADEVEGIFRRCATLTTLQEVQKKYDNGQ